MEVSRKSYGNTNKNKFYEVPLKKRSLMILQRINIELVKLYNNDGQIPGLPKNPRWIDKRRFKKLCRSIKSLPEMTEVRDLIVYPYNNGYVVIGGNMRLKAYRELGWKDAPCCILPEKTPLEKLREIIIQDNNPFGQNDLSLLADEWDQIELEDWGFEVWEDKPDKNANPKPITASKNIDENDKKPDFFSMMIGDRIYDSNNEFDIPNLLIEEQPERGLLLPFAPWGADTRAKKGISTYHFYVEDYRFEAIWKDPTTVLNSGCEVIIEPNLSLFDTTPIAYGLQQIYKKRWISRFFQECGIKVYADLNVAKKFYEYNQMGIPNGYNTFATRGYADRQEYLKMEIQIARNISGKDNPNMLVYGGGERIKELCLRNNLVYVDQFMANRVEKPKKGGNNG